MKTTQPHQSRHNKASVPRIGVAPLHCPRRHSTALQLFDNISPLSNLAVVIAELTMIAPSSCTRPPFVRQTSSGVKICKNDVIAFFRAFFRVFSCQHIHPARLQPPRPKSHAMTPSQDDASAHRHQSRSKQHDLRRREELLGVGVGVGCVAARSLRKASGEGPERPPNKEENEQGPELSILQAAFISAAVGGKPACFGARPLDLTVGATAAAIRNKAIELAAGNQLGSSPGSSADSKGVAKYSAL